jgi:predicted nuclease with TOPRIM domain
MTSDITEVRYWIDLAIKGLIGIVVSIVGMDYRQVKNSLEELQQSKYQITMQVQVMQSELGSIKQRLERIEQKLDQVLDR